MVEGRFRSRRGSTRKERDGQKVCDKRIVTGKKPWMSIRKRRKRRSIVTCTSSERVGIRELGR